MTRALAMATSAIVLASCAARAPVRPTGTETPDPTAIDAFKQATRECAGLKTLSGELRLSGRAGGEPIRGTIHTGLAAPSSLRLEAVAPFGPPAFILAGRSNRATLLFPRDDRVLPDAAVTDLLDRLTGLALGADDLRLILTACLVEQTPPTDGRAWPGGWRAVTVGQGITAYLKDIAGVPAIVAADRGAWRIDYTNHQNGWPRQVRVRSAESGRVDISARINQLELNVPIDEKAFVVDVPPNAERITLQQLRGIAPLRGSS